MAITPPNAPEGPQPPGGQPPPEDTSPSDLQRLLHHMQENPLLYVASAVFIVLCALIGVFYRVYQSYADKTHATTYAEAVMTVDEPEAKVKNLDEIASDLGNLNAEALYMKGESAYEAGLYDKAKEAFTQVREQFPEYQFTPDAVEGLGYIAENNENYEAAAEHYQDVINTWPGSFAARRQHQNLGRVHEAMGNFEKARDAYRDQLDAFPNSNVARHAQEALDRLRGTHPELFPEDAAPAAPESGEGQAPETLQLQPQGAEGGPDIEIAPQGESGGAEAPAESEAPTEAVEVPEIELDGPPPESDSADPADDTAPDDEGNEPASDTPDETPAEDNP